ncbi:MAG: NUDIX hydrolase [Bacilli bacterium]
MKKEETVSQNYLYQGKVLNLRIDDVRLPSGDLGHREVIEHHGGVCGLVVSNDYQILFVKQYRIAFDDFVLELPAGKIEEGETPDMTIIRELEEEIGAKVRSIQKAGVIFPSPGYTSEKIYLYFTKDFELTMNHLDKDEFLEVIPIDINTVYKMVDNNEICDAKTLVLLSKYRNELINLQK